MSDVRQGVSYEIRPRQNRENGRTLIDALVPGLAWPAIVPSEDGAGWLVFVSSAVTEHAGLDRQYLTGVDAINESLALLWVELLAALYLKAVAKWVICQTAGLSTSTDRR
jgi:hypothetical protein